MILREDLDRASRLIYLWDMKPLLACPAPADLSSIRFPVLVSAKLDGIRAIIVNGKLVSRKLLPIPNDYVRAQIEALGLPEGTDGELLLRSRLTAPFKEVSSAIMSKSGEPDFTFAVFDCAGPEPFRARYEVACVAVHEAWRKAEYDGLPHLRVSMVPQSKVYTVQELQDLHDWHIEVGYEGTMIRDPEGRYKFGRSTVKEGILLKMKAWGDEEAVVTGIDQFEHNANEAQVNNLGLTKRSSAKAGQVLEEKMGALRCKFLSDGVDFGVGSGFTEAERVALWGQFKAEEGQPDAGPIGSIVKIKFQLPRAKGQAPRSPVFLGFRHD